MLLETSFLKAEAVSFRRLGSSNVGHNRFVKALGLQKEYREGTRQLVQSRLASVM